MMSKIRDKLKSVVGTIADTVSRSSSFVEEVIKENKQYINSFSRVVIESEEGINSLRKYAEIETPALKTVVSTLANIYETLEEARKEKIAKLQANFITPLEELLVAFKKRQEELKTVEKAKKELDKAEKKYEKEKSKPEEKKDADKIELAKELYENAKKDFEREDKEAEVANKKFDIEKSETFKKILNNIVNIEKDFHENMLQKIKTLEKNTTTNVKGAVKKTESTEPAENG